MGDALKHKAEWHVLEDGFYSGEYLYHQRTGEGIMVYFLGDYYEGQWFADKFHGKGRFIPSDKN